MSDAASQGEDELTEAWRRWDEHRGVWLADADLKAGVVLVETTMRALGDILTGKRRATDVMFPDSSMRLVEGTNQGNKIADFFNGVLADTVIAYIREREAHGAEALHILEIGAGTGGTSAMLLAKLRELNGHQVQEYCYTDISRGFLLHGEQAYGAANPFLTYRLFNVEESLAPQEVPEAAFDIVIAANVLHTTSNIRRSLRNAKAALKKHGLLLLIEMSANTLFSHLTYGLLEGWWAYDDAELRLPGCPALSSRSWRVVLEGEGFQEIFPRRITWWIWGFRSSSPKATVLSTSAGGHPDPNRLHACLSTARLTLRSPHQRGRPPRRMPSFPPDRWRGRPMRLTRWSRHISATPSFDNCPHR